MRISSYIPPYSIWKDRPTNIAYNWLGSSNWLAPSQWESREIEDLGSITASLKQVIKKDPDFFFKRVKAAPVSSNQVPLRITQALLQIGIDLFGVPLNCLWYLGHFCRQLFLSPEKRDPQNPAHRNMLGLYLFIAITTYAVVYDLFKGNGSVWRAILWDKEDKFLFQASLIDRSRLVVTSISYYTLLICAFIESLGWCNDNVPMSFDSRYGVILKLRLGIVGKGGWVLTFNEDNINYLKELINERLKAALDILREILEMDEMELSAKDIKALIENTGVDSSKKLSVSEQKFKEALEKYHILLNVVLGVHPATDRGDKEYMEKYLKELTDERLKAALNILREVVDKCKIGFNTNDIKDIIGTPNSMDGFKVTTPEFKKLKEALEKYHIIQEVIVKIFPSVDAYLIGELTDNVHKVFHENRFEPPNVIENVNVEKMFTDSLKEFKDSKPDIEGPKPNDKYFALKSDILKAKSVCDVLSNHDDIESNIRKVEAAYKILGLPKTATSDEISSKSKKLCAIVHQDKVPEAWKKEAIQLFIIITKAKDYLLSAMEDGS